MPAVGEVLRIDDAITGFDDNKPGRPCLVVRVEDSPRSRAWVVPRTTAGRDGTLTPARVLPGLEQEGRFMYMPRPVESDDLDGCESLGTLPGEWLAQVLENVNLAVVDL